MRYLLTAADHEFREFELRAEKRRENLDELLKGNKITQEEYNQEMDLLNDDIEGFHNL